VKYQPFDSIDLISIAHRKKKPAEPDEAGKAG
jgi:hypothetical protein